MKMTDEKATLISKFYEIEVIKFGEFQLKAGGVSPFYIDLREIISHPKLMQTLAEVVASVVKSLERDQICGVPYGALALASVISVLANTPMVLCRKESKEHGTKKRIDGIYGQGNKCVIIEDVATTGSSILETAEVLRAHGLIVNDAVVVLDRQQGATERLKSQGINLISIVKLQDILARLPATVDQEIRANIQRYLSNNDALAKQIKTSSTEAWSFKKRLDIAQHPVAKRLLEIMLKKKSNLCVAADLTKSAAILKLAANIGSHICAFKLHADIIEDFTLAFATELKRLAQEKEFVVIEDRKFADTGNTVELQTGGVHQLASWANIFTVHGVSGPAVLKGLRKPCIQNGIGCLLVAQMSSGGNLIDDNYEKGCLQMATAFPDIVAGFICQKRFTENPGFLYISPGVNMGNAGDGMNQQWRSPEDAICRDLVDIVIVGRGVIANDDPKSAAETFQNASWSALEKRECMK